MGVIEAAAAYAAARVRYATDFLRFRLNSSSDGQAEQKAIVSTGDEMTVREAELRVALYQLEYDLAREAERACTACRHD